MATQTQLYSISRMLSEMHPSLITGSERLRSRETLTRKLPIQFSNFVEDLYLDYCQGVKFTKIELVIRQLFPAILDAFFKSKTLNKLIAAHSEERLSRLIDHKIRSMTRKINKVISYAERWEDEGVVAPISLLTVVIKTKSASFIHASRNTENDTPLMLHFRRLAGEMQHL